MLKQKQQLELNKDGAKTKIFNVKIKDDTHIVQMDYMKTEEFKTLYKDCHKMETKKCRIKKNNYWKSEFLCKTRYYNTRGNYTFFSQYEENNKVKSRKIKDDNCLYLYNFN